MLTGCSAGWSLEDLILHGLPSVNKMISSLPAKHLSTLCNQMVNFWVLCKMNGQVHNL